MKTVYIGKISEKNGASSMKKLVLGWRKGHDGSWKILSARE